MSKLTKTQIQTFQSTLEQRQTQLQQEIALARQEAEEQAEKDELPREPDANQTRDASDREVRHAEKVRDQQELQDVRAALQRIADGEYGECIDCSKQIALARLQAFPTAKRCIQCQTLHEGKRTGRP